MTLDSPATEAPLRTGRRSGPTKGDLKEAALLAACEELLATRPFASIKIDDLTAKAGLNRSTFYFYFKSRDDLLRALVAPIADQLYEASSAWFGDDVHLAPMDALREAARQDLQLWRQHGPVLRAAVAARDSGSDIGDYWTTVGQRFVTAIVAQINKERAAGRSPAGPPAADDLARALALMTQRVHMEASAGTGSESDDAATVETIATIWYRTIYPAAG